MHVEVQVALNFLISFLYNKLPRRRVNQFGEELEATLKTKFEGHWYPERPYKGSAYRCIRCAPPLDPLIFEVAARHSGMNLSDIQENLPHELSIWVDPGEVSYRISEKSPVKILFSERCELKEICHEPVSVLNPEAQCFRPIDQLTRVTVPVPVESCPSYTSSVTPFMASKNPNHVTFTTGQFAATKFGSTKLKSSGKKGQRSSPTDLGSYIKQKCNQPKDLFVPSRRNCALPLSNNIDSPGVPGYNKQLLDSPEMDAWKCTSTGIYSNIWAALPQLSPEKALPSESVNVFEGHSLFACEVSESIDSTLLSKPKASNTSPMSPSLVDNDRLAIMSDRLWEDIVGQKASEAGEVLHKRPELPCSAGPGKCESVRNEPLYCSSFSLCSMSSPSLSSSNESCSINLVSEFDNLSLNSNSSSSVGSVCSYIT